MIVTKKKFDELNSKYLLALKEIDNLKIVVNSLTEGLTDLRNIIGLLKEETPKHTKRVSLANVPNEQIQFIADNKLPLNNEVASEVKSLLTNKKG